MARKPKAEPKPKLDELTADKLKNMNKLIKLLKEMAGYSVPYELKFWFANSVLKTVEDAMAVTRIGESPKLGTFMYKDRQTGQTFTINIHR